MRPAWRPRAGRAAAACAVALLATSACGKKGPPLPPEPRGPLPPLQVSARQLGERIQIWLKAPLPRGPRPAQQPVRVELLRLTYEPGAPAPPDPDAFRRRGELVATLESDALDPGSRLMIEDATLGSPGDVAGGKLRYAVRVRDRRGRTSPLVVAEDLSPVEAPPAPTGLVGEATADGVRLRWQPPPAAEAARYNIYRSAPGSETGELPLNAAPLASSEYLDTDVEIRRSYRYEVRTAVSDAPPFRESVSGPTVTVVAEDRFAPARPAGLVVVQEGVAVRVFWDPNRERDLLGYHVYRSVDDGEWSAIGPRPVLQPLLLDDDVQIGQHLRYRVTAVDRANPPNESEPSVVAELDLAADPAAPGGMRP